MIRRLLARLTPAPRNPDAPRGLVDRLIARLVPRLPAWLLPTLAGIVVATACGIAWVVFA